jgi:hypothetical protein
MSGWQAMSKCAAHFFTHKANGRAVLDDEIQAWETRRKPDRSSANPTSDVNDDCAWRELGERMICGSIERTSAHQAEIKNIYEGRWQQ